MASPTQKSQITVSGGGSGAKSKAKKGGKQGCGAAAGKKPGRGMGVAQLERIRVEESWKLINDLNPVPLQPGFGVPIRCGDLHEINGGVYSAQPPGTNSYFVRPGFLHGHPVHSYCGSGDQNRLRILNGSGDFDFNAFAFKKKRVMNGEDLEGLARENKCYQGVEILAVHRKGVGTKNMVMEYGFFPANSPAAATSSSPASVSGYATNYPSNSSIDLSLKL